MLGTARLSSRRWLWLGAFLYAYAVARTGARIAIRYEKTAAPFLSVMLIAATQSTSRFNRLSSFSITSMESMVTEQVYIYEREELDIDL